MAPPPRWKTPKPAAGFPTAYQAKPRNPLAKKLHHWEHGLQVGIVDWFRLNVVITDAILIAIPNGGERGALEAARLKEEGALAGVSDLVLILPGRRVHWMEVKLEKNAWHEKTYQKPEQKAFMEAVQGLEHRYTVVRSIEEVMAVLDLEGVAYRSVPYGPSRALRG